MFKKILILIIINSQLVYANQNPMNKANEIINQTKYAAKQDAQDLVEIDVLSAIEHVIRELPQISDFNQEYNFLMSSNEQLKNRFSNIAQKDADQIAKDRDKVMKIYEDYKEAVRLRFKNSFKSAEMNFELNQLVNTINVASKDLERKCEKGNALSYYSYKSGKISVPKLEYQLMIKYSSRLGSDSSTSSIGYDYQIQTAAKSESLDDAKNVNNALLTANGIIASTAFSTNTATALNAALVNGAGAILPYTIALSVAASIATTIAANKEQARLETEVSDAQRYMFYNTADSSDVIHYYKQHCRSVVDAFDDIAETVTTIINDKEQRITILEEAKQTREVRAQWQKDSKINSKLQEQLILHQLYQDNKCLEKYSFSYEIERIKGNNFCYYSDDKVAFNKGFQEFDLDKSQLETKIEELESEIKKFSNTYPVEITTTYLNHQLVELIAPRIHIVENGFNIIAFDFIDKQQARAFQKLTQILTYYRKLKLNENAVFKDLKNQVEVYRSVAKIKADLDKIVALSISEIFSDIGRDELKQSYNKLVQDFEPIKEKYIHLSGINYLDYSITSLESYILSL